VAKMSDRFLNFFVMFTSVVFEFLTNLFCYFSLKLLFQQYPLQNPVTFRCHKAIVEETGSLSEYIGFRDEVQGALSKL